MCIIIYVLLLLLLLLLLLVVVVVVVVVVVARCSSVVRAFAHDAMGRRIDPSWWTHWAISRSNQWSYTKIFL